MNRSFTERKVAINRLSLWDENARFPDKLFNSDQEELIKYFISKEEFKIEELIKEIVKDFDLPQAEKLIVWDNEGELIVLEGNRRLTSYKLLANPDLISEPKKLRKFVKENSLKISITESFNIDCLVTENKEEGLRFIDRKHAKGNNEVRWQDAERAHYNVRRGRSNESEIVKIGISKLVRSLDLPEQIKDSVLGRNYVTTFFRIVTTGPAKKKFGIKVSDNGELVYNEGFREELKIIIHDVLKKETFSGRRIDSRALNRNTQIESYLKSIDKEDLEKVEQEIINNTTTDIFGDKQIQIQQSNKKVILPKSTSRIHLIPQSCRLSISEPKINNIYRELRDDLLLDDSNRSVPNAVAVLFRVFLEISLDFFLEKKGITLSPDTNMNSKINKTCDLMISNKIATDKELRNIRKVSSDLQNILGIQYFHDYIHSYKSSPSSIDLKQKWDNLEEFFQILWDHLFIQAAKK